MLHLKSENYAYYFVLSANIVIILVYIFFHIKQLSAVALNRTWKGILCNHYFLRMGYELLADYAALTCLRLALLG